MTAIGWIAGGLLAWLALAFGVAVVVGRAITTADQRCCPHEVDAPRLADGGGWL